MKTFLISEIRSGMIWVRIFVIEILKWIFRWVLRFLMLGLVLSILGGGFYGVYRYFKKEVPPRAQVQQVPLQPVPTEPVHEAPVSNQSQPQDMKSGWSFVVRAARDIERFVKRR